MFAAFFNRPGSPDVLQYGELPDPLLRPGQVLIRTEAVSVNPIDTYVRGGLVEHAGAFPAIVGADVAGTIEIVGAEVRSWRIGDRVWSTVQGLQGRPGTFAEFCAVDASRVYRIPDEVDFETMAAVALVGVTAELGLHHVARLKSGDTVLVQGGGGAVGSMVLQLAKAAGARVIATAGNAAKCERCLQQGADAAIDYTREPLSAAVARLAPGGANLIWLTSREPNLDEALAIAAEGCQIIVMAGRQARPELPIGPFYVKQCRLFGFVVFKANEDPLRQAAESIAAHVAAGRVRPHIAARFPLSQAAEAHRLQEAMTLERTSDRSGKIVLTPRI